jgi:hypothetical protein
MVHIIDVHIINKLDFFKLGVGKSSLLLRFVTNEFKDGYEATVIIIYIAIFKKNI